MIGRTLSHYRIVDRLGEGGMGVVYRAHDERLERDVALKVLPAGMVAEADRARFRREALALSRLNHPGIATVHDFDRAGDTDFLVMELVEGETLAARLARGPLPLDQVVSIGIQIAEALDAAHAQGVLHRDLKPGNIAVTAEGRVKLLDFGLAELGHAVPPARTGTVASDSISLPGTLPYMAPEQLLGRAGDARADLHAFGVVLYEMATGRLPWRQSLSTALVYEIAIEPRTPPGRVRPELPARFDDVVLKAIERDPALRYATARDLAVDLRRLEAEEPEPARGTDDGRIRSLAVLPLRNLSRDPDQEYFADGMTEALISSLAQIHALCVISRTSAMRFKDAVLPLPDIARELRVDAVVEGSVLRAGDRVRISAQLIEARSDSSLWARSYDRPADDVLDLQSEVARSIADEIRVKLTPREQRRLGAVRAVPPEALEAYLRGRALWNRRTASAVRESLAQFERAAAIDPLYALAQVGIADACNILGDIGALAPQEAFGRARAAAMRAMELDPEMGEPYSSLGFVRLFHDFDWDGARDAFERGLERAPGYATMHQWYSEFLTTQGRDDEAVNEARQGQTLDPLSPIMGTTAADALFFSRRFEEAEAQLRRTIELAPDFPVALSDLGRLLSAMGRHDEAIRAFHDTLRLQGGDPRRSAGLGYALAVGGRPGEARAILANLLSSHEGGYLPPYAVATIHVGLGDREAAFEWLERAWSDRDRALVWLKVHPRLDPLRDDPRFRDLLVRMRLDR